MVLMFGVFAVLFYRDGSTGYREKNLSYYSWQGIKAASDEFPAKQAELGDDGWRRYAATKEFALPEDRSILPDGTPERIPWPDMLADAETMRSAQANPRKLLFEPYMEEADLKKAPPEQAYDAGKIREQWIVFGICVVLALGALFVLLRTLGRKMALEGDRFQPAGGAAVEVKDLVRLDLRKWGTKGLAYAWAAAEGGKERKIRIDGLTYGGFKKDQGEPAERLMEGLKARFSGELIEYRDEAEEALEAPADGSSTPPAG